jgi:hypothetical protein
MERRLLQNVAMAPQSDKVSLTSLTQIAREVLDDSGHQVIAVVPAEGDSAYAEVVVNTASTPGGRLVIGVSRNQSEAGVRDDLARELHGDGCPEAP